jgi:hypothetical protein
MSWQEKREQVTEKMNQLAVQNQNQMSVDQLQTLKQEYDQIRYDLSSYLTQQAQNYQLSDQLEQTGELQQQIQRLHVENDKIKTDVETALARDELLRSRGRTGNDHTLYLLDRPVRRGMVPYLWVLSVLFVGVGVLCFYWLTPMILLPNAVSGNTNIYGASSIAGSITGMLTEVFTNRLTWMALFGASSIVILFLSLKIAGVFGK